MFAGRYLWWNMMACVCYLFFAIYFYYFSWLAIRVSGCASVVGACGELESNMNGLIRPYGLLLSGIALLTAGVLRIHYLRMSPIWGLALFIWFGASADFFFNFGNLWFARIDMRTILAGMPIEALFLAALVLFMCFPVELYKHSPSGGLRVVYYVAGFTASYSFTLSIANSVEALEFVRRYSGSEALTNGFAIAQVQLRTLLGMGQESMVVGAVALGIFVSALSYLIAMRRAPSGHLGGAVAA